MNSIQPTEAFDTIYAYRPASRLGRIVFLAGQIPKTGQTEIHAIGRCGEDVDLATAKESAQVAAGQALAWLARQTGPEECVDRILDLVVNVAVGPDFLEISDVADAASEVFIAALGEQGKHPRSVIGVCRLPRNAPVLLQVKASLIANCRLDEKNKTHTKKNHERSI